MSLVVVQQKKAKNNDIVTYSGHGNTSVLDFGVTVPGKSLITSDLSKAKRVPDLSELVCVGRLQDFVLANAGIQRANASGLVALLNKGGGGNEREGEGDSGEELHGCC